MARIPRSRGERGLHELYRDDPERADALVFGRRRFVKGAGLAAMGAVLGMKIPFARTMPAGLIPAALADEVDWARLLGADGLSVLNDRPINAETPPHLLDDDITPNHLHFVRNNGLMPDETDPATWRLEVDGEIEQPVTFAIGDLERRFEVVTLALQIECGGNGRAGFDPPARGNQWTVGAIGNARWTGIRYRDLLAAVGVKPSAVYTGHYSADRHPSGDPDKEVISRGIPLAKAMREDTLIAFAMNGDPIPMTHGAPLRVVAPGWPGSTSQKWLNRIWVRDRIHDGRKMGGKSYRVPARPVPPGAEVAEADMRIIEAMPVKSLITSPKTGHHMEPGSNLRVRGHAWAGDRAVRRVDVTLDYGATWRRAALAPPPNPGSWQTFAAVLHLAEPGYYEIWARATDEAGIAQPMVVPGWNPRGYLNNAMHRIAVTVA
ncbi:MAG: sulfite oxidase [Alphaproteobacteria bacterium]|jgi:DMSO/TMAO reductase YedYZ molybdopterin-dependent catalytic subunit|nr:sulfite oxidase [Alphaproteobacteria bacterium]